LQPVTSKPHRPSGGRSTPPRPAPRATTRTAPAPSDVPLLPKIVLPAGAVPASFSESLEEAYTPDEIAAQGTYTLDQLRSWGYLGGFEREFERADEADPAKISSDAGAYRTTSGIARAFEQNRVNCQTGGWMILSSNEHLGTSSMLCVRDTSIRGHEARVFFLVWFQGRVKSAVTVTALLGKNNPAFVRELAATQAARY